MSSVVDIHYRYTPAASLVDVASQANSSVMSHQRPNYP